MLYLPHNQDYGQRQYDHYNKEKALDKKPVLKNYGIPIGYDGLQEILSGSEGYVKPADTDYKRELPVTDILPLLDSIVVREMPPGLRGYCFPALRVLYVRDGDQDPGRVNYHENKHIQVFGQDPNHSEWEIRRLENMRYGHEN
ncbi:MAG: hypothetical protein KKE20_02555 [Nanoarchaeota archaeon]|nr:hypothetical protein [Nanoarchaeota archaeon]